MLIFKLAVRNVLRNRRRSLLTIISMGGGYFLLSIMTAMSEGSYNNMIDLFTRDHTGHAQVHMGNYLQRPSLYKTIPKPDGIIKQIQAMPKVMSVAPRIYAPSLAYGDNKSVPANVIAIDPDAEANTSLLKQKLKQGTYLKNGQVDGGYFPVMVGAGIAQTLQLKLQDELVLISQGIDGSIANDVFIVIGFVGNESSFERGNVYMSLAAMQSFINAQQQIHELAIRLQNPNQAQSFANEFQQKLAASVQTENLNVAPWQVIESSFFNSMQADKKGNYVSMGIIIFIVAIGVLNTVLMGTLERTHEFGVLRAIGTRPMGIARLILLESLLLALCSCVLGGLLAWPVNLWMAEVGITMPEAIDMGGILFDKLLGEVSWFSMGMPALVVIGSTLFVSIYPAVRAARISPLAALQDH